MGIYWAALASSLLYLILLDKDLWVAWKLRAKDRLYLKAYSWKPWTIKACFADGQHGDLTAEGRMEGRCYGKEARRGAARLHI